MIVSVKLMESSLNGQRWEIGPELSQQLWGWLELGDLEEHEGAHALLPGIPRMFLQVWTARRPMRTTATSEKPIALERERERSVTNHGHEREGFINKSNKEQGWP